MGGRRDLEDPAATGAPPPPSPSSHPLLALLSQLTTRAETLYERLARLGDRAAELTAEEAQTRLAPWAKAFGRGRVASLERRLHWDGVELAAAAAALGPSPPPAAPATWAADLLSVAQIAQTLGQSLAANGPDALGAWRQRCPEVPFLELWIPWLRHGRDGLGAIPPEILAPTALADLEESLLRDLGRLGEMAAYELFDANRGLQGESGIYGRFVAGVLGDPVATLYGAFPVLARQSALRVRQWQGIVQELVERLAADGSELAVMLGGGEAPGPVVSVAAGLSDRHHGGRQVMALTFGSGLEVVYKPRSVALEADFARFLEWCEEAGCPWVPPRARALPREGYGWMERALQEPLKAAEEARDWYRRAGALVAFAYLLRGQDLHGENIVAAVSGPVLVDAEMLLQPVPVRLSSGPAQSPTAGKPSPGVAGTCRDSGLLTYPEPGADGRPYEWGGLRAEPRRPGSRQRRAWSAVNTDAMRVEAAPAWLEPRANAVRVGEELARAEDHAEEVEEGFEAAYRFLVEKRAHLAAADGALSWFRGAPARLLFRRSQEYANVLSLLALPRHQRSGLSGSMLCEALISPLADSPGRPALWPLVTDERSALLAGDLPRFEVAVDSKTPRSQAGEEVTGYLALSGLEAVSSRLELLSEEDLGRQLELMRQTLAPAQPASAMVLALRHQAELEDRCQSIARALGKELLERHAAGELPESEVALDRGRIGAALFLAALAGEPDADEKPKTAALELVRPMVKALEAPELPRQLASLPLGACAGWGGLAWGLSWLAGLLGEPGLAETAGRCVAPIRRALPEDRTFDLHGGAAGAILGLLAVGSSEALEAARECGEHLLAHQRLASSAGAAWAPPGALPLAGWAHGAAGIARALAALAEAAGHERFRVAAAAAIGYERALFDSEHGNWPVLLGRTGAEEGSRASGVARQRSFMVAWCHGAPGVALSRALLPPAFADEILAAEREIGLQTTARAPLSALDHLCCGNLGRSGVLLTAAQRLEREDLLKAARSLTSSALDRAASAGGLALRDDGPASAPPPLGFLTGISGAGYHLLRMAGRALPDLLAFEHPGERPAFPGAER